jgi:hypothetical protein
MRSGAGSGVPPSGRGSSVFKSLKHVYAQVIDDDRA